jgi:NAD+ synthase (glutamine-hydrolysing)
LVPKSYLPNYREFYELRQFTPGTRARRREVEIDGQTAPFGTDLIFEVEGQPLLKLFVEICEDLWTPLPPSTHAALAGATMLVNLSASNATVGKADYRRSLVTGQSARCLAAYVYSGAGFGESTTDLAWTDTRWCARTDKCSPRASASRWARSSSSRTSISVASTRIACA